MSTVQLSILWDINARPICKSKFSFCHFLSYVCRQKLYFLHFNLISLGRDMKQEICRQNTNFIRDRSPHKPSGSIDGTNRSILFIFILSSIYDEDSSTHLHILGIPKHTKKIENDFLKIEK